MCGQQDSFPSSDEEENPLAIHFLCKGADTLDGMECVEFNVLERDSHASSFLLCEHQEISSLLDIL